MNNLKNNLLLELANINPRLEYNFAASLKLAQKKTSLHALIKSYLETQPKEYLAELKKFSSINLEGRSTEYNPACWIFVPCFNEDHNLTRIIELFDQQAKVFGRDFELCFLLNCPMNTGNYQRLSRSIDILSEAKRCRPYIHIVSKIFSPEDASLGRARKYGFDYCLQRISEESKAVAESAFIVCTEGDTLELSKTYLEDYAKCFPKFSTKLVQGEIHYPENLLERSEHLKIFTSVREAVHLGQGQYHNEFKQFGGLMPCGRNFAVSPALYARVGGIDPVRRPGPEDDIIFGTDIKRLLGESVKEFVPISLVTSPRREVLIIRDLLYGQDTNLKRAYEDFHNAVEIRDFESSDIEKIVENEFPKELDLRFLPTLLSQLYQWVLSSKLKDAVAGHALAKEITKTYEIHELGYWEKENKLWEYGSQWIAGLPKPESEMTASVIADQALYRFQLFNQSLGIKFSRTNKGIFSQLASL